jgi:hypothetical protein
MENEPIRDPRIIEAMEACRQGSDDLADPDLAFLAAHLAADPELNEVHQRLERLDRATADAMGDVPVPEGLADRLLSRLESARAQETDVAGSAPSPAAAPAATTPRPPRRSSRRRWLVGLGSLGLAVAGSLLVATILHRDREVYTEAQVLEAAIRFSESEPPATDDWHLVSDRRPPKDMPMSPFVWQSTQVRWRDLPDFLGHSAVAYDLSRPGGVRATLYVVWRRVLGVPSVPPDRPALTTHNCSVAAWQSNALLYVLVVDGAVIWMCPVGLWP